MPLSTLNANVPDHPYVRPAGRIVASIPPRWALLFRRSRPIRRCLAGCSFLAVLTYAGYLLHANLTTISFTYLLLVLAMALFCGFWEASFVSVLAVGCLDYFFTPPVFQFDITDAQDWIALGSFEVAAVLISRLTARELRAAREASVFRAGMERLYELSRKSLLLDLRKPPGPQLVVLIQGVFAADAVALFDRNLASQDKVGNWKAGEENLAKEGYLEGVARDHPETRTYQRLLRIGSESVGALAVRGDLSSLVADALSSLAAIAIERHRSFEHEERAETVSKSEQLRAAVMDALAHEIKTPLTAVQTASSGLLELGGLTETQRGLITLIDGEALRLNQLCSRLLLTAKLEAHQVGLQIAQVNVRELIADVLSDQSMEAGRNSVSVEVPDPSLTVSADRGLLTMMLAQYIENARKYSTPATSIDITARRSSSEVLISVRNWGPRIPIEDRERIFERFYRSPVQKNSVAGTGIGLSVVRKAAEAHHGHVWVVSDDQEGTTFFVSLPVGEWRMQ